MGLFLTSKQKKYVALLVLCILLLVNSAVFADTLSTPPNAYGDYLYRLGLITGSPKGNLHLREPITRAEIATVITRLHQLYTFTSFEGASKSNTSYTDVPSNFWAVPYIEYCKTNKLMNGVGTNQFAPQTKVTYQQTIMLLANLLKLKTTYANAAPNLDLAYGVGLTGYSSNTQLTREDVFNLVAQMLYVDTDNYILPLSQVLLLLNDIETDTNGLLQGLTSKLKKDSLVTSLVKYDAAKVRIYDRINTAMNDMSLNRGLAFNTNDIPALKNPAKFFEDSRYYLLNTASVTIDFKLETDGTIYLTTQNDLKATNAASIYVNGVIAKYKLANYSTLEQLVFINNYIAYLTEYDTVYEQAFLNKQVQPWKHTAYALIEDNLAVCQGYADLAKLFMDKLSIPNMLAYDDGNLHVWNKVLYNGQWLHLDITWNDNARFGAEAFSMPVEEYPYIYSNFLIDDTIFSKTHGFIDKPTVGSKVINSVPLVNIKKAYDILPYE